MPSATATPGHAIVIGGSIVGSAVGAMLARRFERVTILERDPLRVVPVSRAGVPQARHVHVLLTRGTAEFERLFPGYLEEMVTAGAQLLDVGRDVAWLTPAGWGVPFESGLVVCCATRDLIEWQARRCAQSKPNLRVVDGTSVTGLITDAGESRVIGVRLRDHRQGPQAPARTLLADLVVDTAGRASRLPDWLMAIGRPRVRESVVDAGMTYASRFYAVPKAALRGWRAAYVQPQLPRSPRGGILFPVQGDRWHLTLFGYADAAPPDDEAGFSAFMTGLRSSILADVLRQATPLTPIVRHRRTENRWRHFEEIADWPDGLVAIGDSICCFDPVYGQGMTTGILGALALSAKVDAACARIALHRSGFARGVQRQMAGIVRPAWNLATGEDLRLPTTRGGQLRVRDRLLQRYVDRVTAAATADARVRMRFLSVMNMLVGPEALLHPLVMLGVVRHLCGLTPAGPRVWTERSGETRPAATVRTGGAAAAGSRSGREVAVAGQTR